MFLGTAGSRKELKSHSLCSEAEPARYSVRPEGTANGPVGSRDRGAARRPAAPARGARPRDRRSRALPGTRPPSRGRRDGASGEPRPGGTGGRLGPGHRVVAGAGRRPRSRGTRHRSARAARRAHRRSPGRAGVLRFPAGLIPSPVPSFVPKIGRAAAAIPPAIPFAEDAAGARRYGRAVVEAAGAAIAAGGPAAARGRDPGGPPRRRASPCRAGIRWRRSTPACGSGPVRAGRCAASARRPTRWRSRRMSGRPVTKA